MPRASKEEASRFPQTDPQYSLKAEKSAPEFSGADFFHYSVRNRTSLVPQRKANLSTARNNPFHQKTAHSPHYHIGLLSPVIPYKLRAVLRSQYDSNTVASCRSDEVVGYRLNKAMELLKKGEMNVTEVSYAVGLASLAGFSRSLKNRFGIPPSAV
jgi:AraC-like DNA-binding protein